MNLNDVLLTYNQVKAPQTTKIEEKIQLPDPVNSNMDRFLQYVNKSRDFDIDVDEMTHRFPGWVMANNADLETIEKENNYSNTSFMDNYDKATFEETSINTKIDEFRKQQPQMCQTFFNDLEKFYDTPEGRQYNPDNYGENTSKRELFENMRKILFGIAILESSLNSQAVNGQVLGNKAFGYFQFIEDSGGSEELLQDTNKQFKMAYDYLMDISKTIKSKIDSGIISTDNWNKFQIFYGMWWRPESMISLLKVNPTNEDIENINKDVHGMNLAKILARARTK